MYIDWYDNLTGTLTIEAVCVRTVVLRDGRRLGRWAVFLDYALLMSSARELCRPGPWRAPRY